MALTRPIPKEARLMVDLIRKDVPKPKVLPSYNRDSLGWWSDKQKYCPMGLHPKSEQACPEGPFSFDANWKDTMYRDHGAEIFRKAVVEFGTWWDEQTDAGAAIEAVWSNS